MKTCIICASQRVYYAFSLGQCRVVTCRDCSHMMLSPQPSDEQLAEIYGAQYALLNRDDTERRHFSSMKQATAEYYLNLVGEYRGGHRGALLEIGCGQGDLLEVADRLGYDVTGVEYSPYSCEAARRRLKGRGAIISGELRDTSVPEGAFDVCVLSDVIEHIRDPRSFLQLIHRALKPGGVLFVSTPTLDSWSARLLKQNWMEFKLEHLHYFNQNTLLSLLSQTGYREPVTLPGVKFLSLDYVADHFEKYPVPRFSFAVGMLRSLLPSRVRQKHRRIVASGMIVMCSAGAVPARRKLSVILPAFNEAATLETVLKGLLAKDLEPLEKEIVLVESNSTDGTREIALRYRDHPNVRLVLEDRPRGKGHAVRAGLALATGDFILIQDADLEYDFEDYEVLLEPMLNGRSAFVLGSRHGGRIWKLRSFKGSAVLNLGHWIFKALVNVFFGLNLKDPFTMYKVFRRDCLTGLSLECNRFDFDFELLIKLVRNGYRPLEIPVNYRSRSFQEGKKVSMLRDPWTWIRALCKYRFTRLNQLANVPKEVPVVEATDRKSAAA